MALEKNLMYRFVHIACKNYKIFALFDNWYIRYMGKYSTSIIGDNWTHCLNKYCKVSFIFTEINSTECAEDLVVQNLPKFNPGFSEYLK